MSAEKKCFCHLNGYEVKDATARAEIENLKANGTGGNPVIAEGRAQIYYESQELIVFETNASVIMLRLQDESNSNLYTVLTFDITPIDELTTITYYCNKPDSNMGIFNVGKQGNSVSIVYERSSADGLNYKIYKIV